MGLFNSLNAASCRIGAALTVLLGVSGIFEWGILPGLLIIAGGVFLYAVGGDPHRQSGIRRVVSGAGWGLAMFIALAFIP